MPDSHAPQCLTSQIVQNLSDSPQSKTNLGGNSRTDVVDLLRKSGVSLVLRVAGGLAAFVMTLVAGRLLGTAGSGLFFLCLAIVTVAAALSRLGLDQAITRFVSESRARRDWDSVNGMYSRALVATFFTSSSLSILLFFSAKFICNSVFYEPEMTGVFRWMSLSVVGFAVTWIHSHFFQGLEEVKRYQAFQNLGVTAIFLVALGLQIVITPSASVPPEVFGGCFLTASLLSAIAAHLTWRSHTWFSWRGSTSGWQALWPLLLPFFGMLIIQQLNTWFPQLILGVLRPADEVGIYNASFRVANLTSLVLLGVNSVVFPKFAALYADGQHDRLRYLAQTSAKWMTLACLPLLALLLIFPTAVLGLFGEKFEEGAFALRILAIGQLVNVATGSVGGLLNMTGHENVALQCLAISAVVTFVLMVCLPMVFGFCGTAIAQASGVILNMLLLSRAAQKLLGYSPITWANSTKPRNSQ